MQRLYTIIIILLILIAGFIQKKEHYYLSSLKEQKQQEIDNHTYVNNTFDYSDYKKRLNNLKNN